jgi:hypothetical protein
MVNKSLIKHVLKGLLTYIPFVNHYIENKKSHSNHSSSKAEFCYSLWLGLLVYMDNSEEKISLNNVGEIGTGNSLGIAICALLTSTEKYYCLEQHLTLNKEATLKMLDEIVLLIQDKTPINLSPNKVNLKIKNYAFPEHLIQKSKFNDQTIEQLRKEILEGNFKYGKINIINNWEKQPSSKLDFIISRAVMEHVKNPLFIYTKIHHWLKDGGYSFHDIELHSHGITNDTNGHLKINKYTWFFIFGNRPYFLNRWTFEMHVQAISTTGFEVKDAQINYTLNKKEVFGGILLLGKNINPV